ncbi:RsbR protein [Halalkalibacillus sediminis]|uniref:RsbR protein n=1 Tax=Halalkalibacillus sediminis TaxID=2018042 RepID=A0A2I0QRR6_9BACI|nr:STAS domain-containing protein [Halalkalibacillus sediminis]PKR77009.1 RsbR protein [Halalkalibacillus sediminis]
MSVDVRSIVLENKEKIENKWLSQLDQTRLQDYTSTISTDLIEEQNREFVSVIFSTIEKDNSYDHINQFSERIVNLGWPLGYLTEGMQTFRTVSINVILNAVEEESKEVFLQVMQDVNNWVDPIKNQLINEYSSNWNNTVSLQRVALQELSAPLIPVMEGITVLPLVGTIDTDRAKTIMENLLDGVIKHRSSVVLIDITGVPVVDTMVAHHIIQAAEAVRLVGATCILVGIRPEVAQTIVNLGIDLSKFPTKSSLKKGFESALEMTDRYIVSTKKQMDEAENILDSIGKE